jgi:hypothetical integral membrane protein (TIGR02206 family)
MTEPSAVFSGNAWHLFVPFGAVHLVTAASCATLIAIVTLVGRRWRNTQAERQARVGLAVFALAFWAVHNAWWNWNGIDLYNGLPLQICDLAGLVAPLALLTLNPWLRAILYFWGFALSVLAFVQPTVTVGPAHVHFWMFWTAHTLIISCAAYDVVAGGFRPGWSDFRRVAITSMSYLVAVLAINMVLGSNYGYVGNPPPERKLPALVKAFGPWPDRVAVIAALSTLAFLLLLLPWLAVARRRQAALGG